MINKTKRLMVPRTVKIPRKTYFWGPTPLPGRHKADHSVTLLTIIRDYLRLSDKEREATRILANGLVKVDGKVVKERKFGVGFMDVIEISGESYRVVYNNQGALVLVSESKDRANMKPLQVKNKVIAPGNKIQLGFHDGRVMVTEDRSISVGDVVIASLPDMKITEIIKMQPGNKAFITGGSHVGETGTISKIEIKESSSANLVHFDEGFTTVKDHVFVIGSPRFTFTMPSGEVYP
ncbi:ribosomal protein small subunit S4 [Thermoplasma volcanium GSS1]|uniref:Small ribosomal subunit protein eS4 n=1 Tax=Thermoplasma volcanium (strain ATCC 51530 / DSM 4299 / JCM 9571 / NBRC 15438 / GSS1) TaxID=273116 RepID=RS4E_THEVO|nr:30S ribosomal protein S4e [Thermoplasma volcanium]Q97BW4.1 RecName: Full=Small ribosomal subunit protein eS4; AltName: Full=30S ribosomal protein S4e [Thermoplasma volcanium GSS1]BAB59483.1 ribosomal protein small subunit S4 [Thermoplasma volcanium GSS1]